MIDPPIIPANNFSGHAWEWWLVHRGLTMKLWAMWLLFAAPLAAGLAWNVNWNLMVLVSIVLALALLIDTIGRIFCLVGTYRLGISKLALEASVLVQCIGIMAAVCLVFPPTQEATIGIAVIVLIFCQVVAAFTFTEYLRCLANLLGRRDLDELAGGLMGSLIANSVTTIALTMVAVCTLAFALILFVPLQYLAPYAAAFVGSFFFLPLSFLWLATAIRLFTRYGLLINRVRGMIRSNLAIDDADFHSVP